MKTVYIIFLVFILSCQEKSKSSIQFQLNSNLKFINKKIVSSIQKYISENNPNYEVCLIHYSPKLVNDTNHIIITQLDKIPENYIITFTLNGRTIYLLSSLSDILQTQPINQNPELINFCPTEWLIQLKDSTFFRLKTKFDPTEFRRQNENRILFMPPEILPPKSE
ncbi:hypothetical protein EMA8858_04181 [Emticicia aquatica]|uniref:Uncharacterized protein n=1 Tax=Emticicia aquatica TaxID=1681835 RepID=A0ABN8F3L3_9BACT|nr:hypothetical protein [Emticicia aquatica]CAH0998046.1 hypothetical protein EMA8858_04181 [Emticicia aquatica]